MDGKFNDVETDFDLEHLKFGLITILLSEIQNLYRQHDEQEWGVKHFFRDYSLSHLNVSIERIYIERVRSFSS